MNPAYAQTKPAATRVLRIAVIAGISLCPITLAANTWTQQFPAASPSPRTAHAMAAVSGTDQIVLFGGDNGNDLDGETWIYDVSANTWEQQSPAGSPSPRLFHAMAAVSGTDQIVLFGGDDNALDGETWVYDVGANTWTQQSPAGSPSPRFGHAMVEVSGTHQIVLFGGYDGSYDGNTWVYDFDANTWTQQFPAGSTPSGRLFHTMAEVSGSHHIVLFGGDAGTYDGETWVYDLDANTWTQELPASTPSPRNFHGMAGVSGTDQIVLFGGYLPPYDGETWVYGLVANTWTQQFPASTPSPRRQHGMAGVSETGQIVLFGGRDDDRYGDTWVYDSGVATAPTLAGLKYYDADADGEYDAGEEGIEGWPIDFFVDGVPTTLSTTADGTFNESFDPAEYTIAERASLDSRWIQTGNLLDQSNGNFLNADMTYTVLAETGGSYEGLNFGNLCVGPGGAPAGVGGTGYWTNKNGQSLIGADDIALLVALNLRNANGSHFVPANAAAVKTWLKSAKATNMAYMLSAQLAATELNVLNGFVSGTQLILAPGTSSANTNGFATLDSVRAEANTELGAHGLTKVPSSDRSYQEALKNALAIANLNQTFVQESAANCPAPF